LDELAQAGIGSENLLFGQRFVAAPALPVKLLGHGIQVEGSAELSGPVKPGSCDGEIWILFLDPKGTQIGDRCREGLISVAREHQGDVVRELLQLVHLDEWLFLRGHGLGG
jgi:hypothetical protein